MPPGKEGKITLALQHTDGWVGEVAKSANVITNDPANSNFNLMLRAYFKAESKPGEPTSANKYAAEGRRVGPFNVSPNDRWVTSVISGSGTASKLFLYNREAAPIHIKKVIAGGTNFTASLQTIEAGKRYELSVATNPALKPGQYGQTVRLLTDSAASPEVTVELEVTVFPHVFATPTSIILPKLPITIDLSSINLPQIYVRKVRGGGLKIKNVSSTLPFVKLTLTTETEGQFYRVHITLDNKFVKSPGEFRGKIRIETNDGESPVIEIPVQASFT